MVWFPAVVLLLLLVVAELTPPGDAPWSGVRAAGSIALAMCAPAWTIWRLRRLREQVWHDAGDEITTEMLGARLDASERSGLLIWAATSLLAIVGLGWGQVVRHAWGLAAWPAVDDLVLIAPPVLSLLWIWNAAYPLERWLMARPGIGRCRWLWQRLAHGPLLVLLPVLFLLAVQDSVRLVAPQLSEEAKLVVVYLPALLALLLAFPWLLRLLWETRSLPAGELRLRLEASLQRAGIPALDILLWRSPASSANAAVTGVLPRWRYVLLTEGLAARLSPEQIEAIFWHELGHIRHRHLWLRLAAVLLPVALVPLLWDVGQKVVGLWSTTLVERFEQWEAQYPVAWAVVRIALLAGVFATLFGAFARRLEWQADLYAYRQLARGHVGEQGAGEQGAEAALRQYCGALARLATAAGIDPCKFQWQHGSIALRIARLRHWHQYPATARRFEQRLRLVTAALVGAVVMGLLHSGLKWLG